MVDIRLLRAEESEELNRFLERGFGHGWGWFYRRRPALARVELMMQYSLVGLEQGHIVSHVGTYPLPLRSGPVHLTAGGVGNVATAAEARGKGYMSRMLPAAVEHMERLGWPLSVLWGDRRRYARFGWERAGSLLHVTLTQRSLADWGPVSVHDVDPSDADHARAVAAFHEHIPYRVDRPDLPLMLQAPDVRLFLGEEGYLISTGTRSGDLHVIEVSSPAGKEPGLIVAAMERAGAEKAYVMMEPAANARTKRVLAAAAGWKLESRAMFRIVHWVHFLQAAAPWFARKAVGLPPFSVSATCYYATDDAEEMTATLRWDGREFQVTEGPGARRAIRLEGREWVRLLLGAPSLPAHVCEHDVGMLRYVLPIPLHIPRLDFV